ncbi:MAG: hypothetical protein JWP01_2197 [Myxococcales bacterium]|nr:hypothetical protein [Myxococcales bacterium]
MKIAELPLRERPVLELLNLVGERATPDCEYAGYGWARVDRLWLATDDQRGRAVDDVLLLALHSADDAEALADDIELEFELSVGAPVSVLASAFLARWLPRLPADASAIVLALCNPHRAVLRTPPGKTPIHYAHGDVTSWLDRDDDGDHIRLQADEWSTLRAT